MPASGAWPASTPARIPRSSAWRSRGRSSTGRSRRSRRRSPSRPSPRATAREPLRPHDEVRGRAGRRGLEPAQFGIFVDPVHCKGCAECVEVCHALGYDALRMIDKVPRRPTARATLERYARDMRFFRSLRPTPAEYRNEKALADLMLGEHAIGYVGGAGSCSGCGEATAIRMLVAATRQVHGPDVDGHRRGHRLQHRVRQHLSVQPVPRAVDELAVRERAGRRSRHPGALGPGRPPGAEAVGHRRRRGDVRHRLPGPVAHGRLGADIKVLVLDTQVYSNTGGQASTASFGGQVTKLSAFGKAVHGRPEPRKELGRILVAHGERVRGADDPRPHQPLLPGGHGGERLPGPGDRDRLRALPAGARDRRRRVDAQAKLAVESRAFPLFTYDPRRGSELSRALVAAGQPRPPRGLGALPDGSVVDFLAFARTEGRFAAHFDADGAPSPEIAATQADRLANWHALQELAGLSVPGQKA